MCGFVLGESVRSALVRVMSGAPFEDRLDYFQVIGLSRSSR